MRFKVHMGRCPYHSETYAEDDDFIPYDVKWGFHKNYEEVAIHEDHGCIRCLLARKQTRKFVPYADFKKYQERKYGRLKDVA